ncbi:THUMP domain-containing protein 1 homolog [Zeugodacus cucurbitae]|uniref:THUMP domain-containing protein 1 homolog n=1 Tax=Zeugodacus cucurbitae TaxID=28588 RepID=UPI0005967EB8|nr:THUMP domain-containing protein 1 homolog [Zeugodacus cucurbitae]
MSGPAAKKQKFSHYKQKNYFKSNKRQFLEAGQRGFLATCNFREKDCVREAYNVLNHYADELYGPKDKDEITLDAEAEPEDVGDIADDLQKEIDATKATKQNKNTVKQRFQVVDTGATNCVFIRTTLADPVELGTRIVSDVAETREQKSRFLLRLVPVEVVCRANLADITSAGGVLFDKYFLKEGTTFAIIFNKRYNNDVKRDDVIHDLAALVQSKNIKNRVDLKQAEKTIVVEVIKGLCCLSVLDGYLKYKKYNLVELANNKDKGANEVKVEQQSEVSSVELAKDSQLAREPKGDEKPIDNKNEQSVDADTNEKDVATNAE